MISHHVGVMAGALLPALHAITRMNHEIVSKHIGWPALGLDFARASCATRAQSIETPLKAGMPLLTASARIGCRVIIRHATDCRVEHAKRTTRTALFQNGERES